MKRKDFEWLTDEFMVYCRRAQLREKSMKSYWRCDHVKLTRTDFLLHELPMPKI